MSLLEESELDGSPRLSAFEPGVEACQQSQSDQDHEGQEDPENGTTVLKTYQSAEDDRRDQCKPNIRPVKLAMRVVIPTRESCATPESGLHVNLLLLYFGTLPDPLASSVFSQVASVLLERRRVPEPRARSC